MNHWVGICEWESFPFSGSTPSPAGRVSSSGNCIFIPKSLLFVLLAKSCWSPAHGVRALVWSWDFSANAYYLSDCTLGCCERPVPGWLFPLCRQRCPAGASSGVLLFQEGFLKCHLQPLRSPTQSGLPHREVAGSKVLYTMKYLQGAGFIF